jgi:hypothetical protein
MAAGRAQAIGFFGGFCAPPGVNVPSGFPSAGTGAGPQGLSCSPLGHWRGGEGRR